uniref:Uncharacterized protein n=1 Tax=Ditylenchus dipsaci TaxID=166011 RepID=A0A915EEE5_9BILA
MKLDRTVYLADNGAKIGLGAVKSQKSPDDSEIESRWENLVFPDNLIDKVKNLYDVYSSDKWEYNVNCRLRFPSQPKVDSHLQKGRCLVDGVRKPATCFQEPIHYNYTWNPELASFPSELAILQRFPKCWSKLGSLLCGTIYRPCNLKKVFKHAVGKMQLTDITTDELWQVFYPDFCQNAAKDCSFLEVLWPSFLRCSDQVPAQIIPTVPKGTDTADLKLFNPSCKVAYVQSPSQPKKYQCLWPLIHEKSEEAMSARPLIDECFMPCRSPLLATQSSFDYFYYSAAVLCAVSFSIYFYLAWLSRSTLTTLKNEVDRIGFGSLYGLQSLFHLCNLEGAFCFSRPLPLQYGRLVGNLASFSPSRIQIFSFLLNRLMFGSHPSEADHKVRLMSPSSPTAISTRQLHSVLIYTLSTIYTLLILMISEVPVEARLGVCHYGTSNTHKSLYLYLPTNVLLLMLLFVYAGVVMEKAKCPKTSEKAAMLEEMTLTKLALIEEGKESGAKINRTERNESEVPSLFPSEFFVVLLILILLSSGATLAGYFFWQSHDEVEMVRQSVFCSLQATISGKNTSLDWMQHNSWKEDMFLSPSSPIDPFSRRQKLQRHLSAPSCFLPVEEDWIYLFMSLLVLPSLPILLIFVWFFVGFFKGVSYSSQLSEIRAEILPCKRRPNFSTMSSKSNLPGTDPAAEDNTRLLPSQPAAQTAKPRKHRRFSFRSSSEFSTTSSSHTWIMPRMAFSSGNINHVLRDNGSENLTAKSDPTSNPRHRRRDLNQRRKQYRNERRQKDKTERQKGSVCPFLGTAKRSWISLSIQISGQVLVLLSRLCISLGHSAHQVELGLQREDFLLVDERLRLQIIYITVQIITKSNLLNFVVQSVGLLEIVLVSLAAVGNLIVQVYPLLLQIIQCVLQFSGVHIQQVIQLSQLLGEFLCFGLLCGQTLKPPQPFPSDRVSLNSSGTFNFTSVSEKETQVVDQPNSLDTVYAWGMAHGIIAGQQHQRERFHELNSHLAKQLQECRHTQSCDMSPRTAQNSATEETGESDEEEEDDSQEEDLEDESDDAESVDDEDDYEEEEDEDTSTLRNTTDGSTETFDSEDKPRPKEEALFVKYLAKLEKLKKNAREPLPWQILTTSTSNTDPDKSSGLQ